MPEPMLSFGVMGSIFIERLLGIEKPRVGVLSIGEEPGKGNELTLQTYKLLSQSPVNFIGNVEGRDVLKGSVDVVVCDGFVGNIVLKFAESFNKVFSLSLKRNIGKRILANIGAFLLIPAFKRTKQIFDWEEYGGVPLLGVNGVCIICHGKSSPKAIKNAITEAEKIVLEKVNDSIRAEINSLGAKIE
jgi:glycerol-3-phosphate acyltransferase PlsX